LGKNQGLLDKRQKFDKIIYMTRDPFLKEHWEEKAKKDRNKNKLG